MTNLTQAIQAAIADPTPESFSDVLQEFVNEYDATFTQVGAQVGANRTSVSRWIHQRITPKNYRMLQTLQSLLAAVTTAQPVQAQPPAQTAPAPVQSAGFTGGSSGKLSPFMIRATPMLSGALYPGMSLEDAIHECVGAAVEIGSCFSSAEIVRLIRSQLDILRFTQRHAGGIIRENWSAWAPSYVQVSRMTSGATRHEVFVYGPDTASAMSYDFEI